MSEIRKSLHKDIVGLICLSDLIPKITAADGCNEKEASTFLLQSIAEIKSDLKIKIKYVNSIQAILGDEAFNRIQEPLVKTIHFGNFVEGVDSNHSLQEYYFDFKQIAALLKEKSIDIGSQAPLPTYLSNYPEWAFKYISWKTFTRHEVALLLLNFDPFSRHTYFEEEDHPFKTEYDGPYFFANKSLDQGIAGGELISQKNESNQEIFDHGNIRTWCRKIGKQWCIPVAPDLGNGEDLATLRFGSTLGERIVQLTEDNNQKQSEINNLSKAVDRLNNEIKQLLKKLEDAAMNQQTLKLQINSENEDVFKSFKKEIMLRMIGGMTTILGVHQKMDKLDGFKDLAKDLDLKGAKFDEKTLRKYLKEGLNQLNVHK